MAVVTGVDGRRGGWAVAVLSLADAGRPASVRWHTVPGQDAAGFRAVLDLARSLGAAAVGVDCPIGLPSGDWRPCDLLAKRRLGAASARVFLAPPREVLAAATYADARVVARAVLGGRGVSAQTYGLRRMVLAVDEVVRSADPFARRVAEVHPELSFMTMAGRGPGDPLPSKKLPAGRLARQAVLGRLLPEEGTDGVPDGDDHLDALAAAWSAARWAAGTAEVLGGGPDRYRIPMRIVV